MVPRLKKLKSDGNDGYGRDFVKIAANIIEIFTMVLKQKCSA